jgi:hypothetical protein
MKFVTRSLSCLLLGDEDFYGVETGHEIEISF